MLSYARNVVAFLVWNKPTAIMASIAALIAVGVIASTAAPALLRRRRKISLLAVSRLPLALEAALCYNTVRLLLGRSGVGCWDYQRQDSVIPSYLVATYSSIPGFGLFGNSKKEALSENPLVLFFHSARSPVP